MSMYFPVSSKVSARPRTLRDRLGLLRAEIGLDQRRPAALGELLQGFILLGFSGFQRVATASVFGCLSSYQMDL